jgi:hypothetical protein
MDYTPIGIGRVLAAFALTVVVGLMPIVAIVLNRNPFSVSDSYGWLVLGLGSIAAAMTLVGLTWRAVVFGRRVVGRPSRA